MANDVRGRYDWLDEAFDRGYRMGLAHGSKNTGLTWVMRNDVEPDSGAEVAVAVARNGKSKRKKMLQGRAAYGILTGRFFDERDAIAEGCFLFFREPKCVVAIDETNRYILWDDVLAWAYLNAPEIGEEKKGDF